MLLGQQCDDQAACRQCRTWSVATEQVFGYHVCVFRHGNQDIGNKMGKSEPGVKRLST